MTLLSQLVDFDQDFIFGDAANSGQQVVVDKDYVVDQTFTVKNKGSNLTAKEINVNVQTSDRCFNERIDWEMVNIVDTVEDRIQNAILTAIDHKITGRIGLAVRLSYASSGRDATSVTANPERGERMGVTASFENVSERSTTFHELNANDETLKNTPGETSDNEFSWPQYGNCILQIYKKSP